MFAGAPAKSISAKNHQDLYRTARHWRCIFAVYIGRWYVIDLSQIGIRNHLARRPRLCDSCKRVIHMGERSAIGLAQIETRKSYCSFVYDLCDRVTRIVTGGYLSLACNCRINKKKKGGGKEGKHANG